MHWQIFQTLSTKNNNNLLAKIKVMTRTGEREIQSVSRSLLDNLRVLASSVNRLLMSAKNEK